MCLSYADILELHLHGVRIGDYLIPDIFRLVRTGVDDRRVAAMEFINEVLPWDELMNGYESEQRVHIDDFEIRMGYISETVDYMAIMQKYLDAGLLSVIDEIFLSHADEIPLLSRARAIFSKFMECVAKMPTILAAVSGQLGVILGHVDGTTVLGEDTTRIIKEILAKMPSM